MCMVMLVLIMWYMIVLCWPAGRLAKCHAKRHLELQDTAAGCTTCVGVADKSAGPVLMAIHMPVCLVFY